jgi:TonB family protein
MGRDPRRDAMDRRPPAIRTLISPASIAGRAHAGRRLAVALGVALAVIVLVVLLDPGGREIARRLTPYGAEGPLRVMPEISIDEGTAEVYQKPKQAPRESAPIYEIEPETISPRATQAVPVQPAEPRPRVDVAAEVVEEGIGEVELLLPRATADQAFIIRNIVRPIYPVDATESERRRPEILVRAAVFLDETGAITAAMITYSEGGPAFDEVALAAVKQWAFEPVIRDGKPPAPRWLEIPWRFKSPYRVN